MFNSKFLKTVIFSIVLLAPAMIQPSEPIKKTVTLEVRANGNNKTYEIHKRQANELIREFFSKIRNPDWYQGYKLTVFAKRTKDKYHNAFIMERHNDPAVYRTIVKYDTSHTNKPDLFTDVYTYGGSNFELAKRAIDDFVETLNQKPNIHYAFPLRMRKLGKRTTDEYITLEHPDADHIYRELRLFHIIK